MVNEFSKQERLTPHNYDAERGVIGCLLQNNNLVDEATSIIDSDMFFEPIYAALFKSIIELKSTGYVIDEITLKDKTIPKAAGTSISDKIKSIRKKVADEGFDVTRLTDDFFAEILNSAVVSSNISHYCNIVKEKYLLRKTIELGEKICQDCREGNKSIQEICEYGQNTLFDFSKTSGQKTYRKVSDLISEALDDIEKAAKAPGGITGVRTGFKDMDRLTSGFQDSDMIVLAARPSQGKTSFALNLAYNISKINKQYVMFFSLEMSAKQLLKRLLAMESGIDGQTIRSGQLTDTEWTKLAASTKIITGTNIFVDDDSYLTIAQFRNKCKKLDAELRKKRGEEKGIDIVIVDYIQLMHAGADFKNGDRITGFSSMQEELSEISRNIKAIAKELNIPVIALAQLNREVDKSKNTEPKLSDIKGSGAIEQDADIVMMIHRPQNKEENSFGMGDYQNNNYNDNETDIIFAKHRNGSTETIKLKFDKATTRFEDMDEKRNV